MNREDTNNLIIYQAEDGGIELRADVGGETIWARQEQIASLFGIERSVVTKHIGNIYEEIELEEDATCANFAQVQQEGSRKVSRQVKNYNLDMIISVGYRVNSKKATQFRRWATEVLRGHITEGYTLNRSRIQDNLSMFLSAVEDIKLLSEKTEKVSSGDVLELVKTFAHTWFSLESYDKEDLPERGNRTGGGDLESISEILTENLQVLKGELMQQKEATDLFAQEKKKGSFEGIIKNIFQGAFGQDMYPTIEEKAAHLLYFVTKNHVFNDGNKRSAAFSFIWFLDQAGLDVRLLFSPDALAVLTLLVAESDPADKDRIIGMILLILQKKEL